MKRKPSWGLFWMWAAIYTVLDGIVSAAMDGRFAWSQLNGVLEGALLAAAITWLFALRKWYKSEGF
jgi:hypothetical protein